MSWRARSESWLPRGSDSDTVHLVIPVNDSDPVKSLTRLADNFTQSFYERHWSGELDRSLSGLSIAQAYEVQDLVAESRIRQGEEVAGYKVGCTSKAIRTQFGLSEPISARLFRPHIYGEGTNIDWCNFANCAIEPEMVFTIGSDLHGTDLPEDRLVEAIESVRVGIELHNFRFLFGPPTSQELICSGGIHAGLILSQTCVSPEQLSFCNEMFSVRKNDTLITEGPASEIMGGPLHSLRWLVGSLTNRGSSLKKGSLVIPGSPVELVAIDQDTEVTVEIDDVGVLKANFRNERPDEN
jgi:2-keto-4-pentenoate hydratase